MVQKKFCEPDKTFRHMFYGLWQLGAGFGFPCVLHCPLVSSGIFVCTLHHLLPVTHQPSQNISSDPVRFPTAPLFTVCSGFRSWIFLLQQHLWFHFRKLPAELSHIGPPSQQTAISLHVRKPRSLKLELKICSMNYNWP